MAYMLVLSDSRGSGLDSFVEETNIVPVDFKTKIIVIPGATIDTLASELISNSQKIMTNHKFTKLVVILYGGICDMTTLRRTPGNEQVSYVPNDSTLTQIKSAIDKVIKYTMDHDISLVLSTIMPVDLIKSKDYKMRTGKLFISSYTDEDLLAQQEHLIADLKNVNDYIISQAITKNITYVNVAREIEKVSIKKKGGKKIHNNFVHLFDGVHSDDTLKKKIFNKLINSLKYTGDEHDSLDELSTSNFKRVKTSVSISIFDT